MMRGTVLRYMSKTSLVAVIFFLALTLVLGMNQASAVAATPLPPLPNLFYGTLQVNGQAVPAGKVVVAKIHGVECGTITVLYPGKYGSDDQGNFGAGIQRLVVSGHTGDTGATIEFYLGTIKADQTAAFQSGGPDPVKLGLTTPPAAPVANAGADQTVKDSDGNGQETVTLDGSASYDPDLNITAWQWSEGTSVLGSGKTLAYDFAVGSHTVTLKVTDSSGLPASDGTAITVNSSQSTEPPPTPDPTPTPNPPAPTPNPPAPTPNPSAILAPTTTQDESPAVTPAPGQPATPESPAAPAGEEQHHGGLNWWLIGGISAAALFLIVLLFVMRKPNRAVSGR